MNYLLTATCLVAFLSAPQEGAAQDAVRARAHEPSGRRGRRRGWGCSDRLGRVLVLKLGDHHLDEIFSLQREALLRHLVRRTGHGLWNLSGRHAERFDQDASKRLDF